MVLRAPGRGASLHVQPSAAKVTRPKIAAVADAYVAITSDRPHRPRVEGAEARGRLQSAAGTQLDAELVRIFLGRLVS